jgi:DNA-binding transcriptional MerR regulator
MAGFRTTLVAKATGVNAETLAYWDKTGLLRPSLSRACGSGTRRLYSYEDILALKVISRLRKEGLSLQKLRKVSEVLQGCKQGGGGFVKSYLVLDGGDVRLRSGDELLSVLAEPGQRFFQFLDLTPTIQELNAAIPKPGQSARREDAKTRKARAV